MVLREIGKEFTCNLTDCIFSTKQKEVIEEVPGLYQIAASADYIFIERLGIVAVEMTVSIYNSSRLSYYALHDSTTGEKLYVEDSARLLTVVSHYCKAYGIELSYTELAAFPCTYVFDDSEFVREFLQNRNSSDIAEDAKD